MSTRSRVIVFIAERFNLAPTLVHNNTHFMADLGLTSLNAMETLCEIEEQFAVKISDANARRLHRVGDLIALLDQTYEVEEAEMRMTP